MCTQLPNLHRSMVVAYWNKTHSCSPKVHDNVASYFYSFSPSLCVELGCICLISVLTRDSKGECLLTVTAAARLNSLMSFLVEGSSGLCLCEEEIRLSKEFLPFKNFIIIDGSLALQACVPDLFTRYETWEKWTGIWMKEEIWVNSETGLLAHVNLCFSWDQNLYFGRSNILRTSLPSHYFQPRDLNIMENIMT